MLNSASRESGFTLMEVLIAVAITAVIGAGTWKVIAGIITAKERVDQKAEQVDHIQKAMMLLERDIYHIVNRTTRDAYGERRPALSNINDYFELEMTRQGWRNPLGLHRSNLQRVAWQLSDAGLSRYYWLELDSGVADIEPKQVLFPGINDFKLGFLDKKDVWHSQWPLEKDQFDKAWEEGSVALPKAIRITIESEGLGKMDRLFVLPDFEKVYLEAPVGSLPVLPK